MPLARPMLILKSASKFGTSYCARLLAPPPVLPCAQSALPCRRPFANSPKADLGNFKPS
jgi:hypothetical protein